MCVLLPKVSIFISLRRGVPADIKKATTNLNMLLETMVPDLKQQKEFIKFFFVVDLQISTRLEQIP